MRSRGTTICTTKSILSSVTCHERPNSLVENQVDLFRFQAAQPTFQKARETQEEAATDGKIEKSNFYNDLDHSLSHADIEKHRERIEAQLSSKPRNAFLVHRTKSLKW